MKKNIKNYNLEELKQELANLGEKPYRAGQVYEWIYKNKVQSFDEMTNLSKELRNKLKENFSMGKKLESVDGTKKYLFNINDGSR